MFDGIEIRCRAFCKTLQIIWLAVLICLITLVPGAVQAPCTGGPFQAPIVAASIHPPAEKRPRPPAEKPGYSAESLRGKAAERCYDSIVMQAASRHNVEPALIKAIIMAESGYNPRAVSKKGARGLMQLMPNTAKALGLEDSFDPTHNIHAGVKYFKRLLERFDNDVRLALAAYNAGSRKVREYNGVPPFGATKCYIEKVMEYYRLYKADTEGGKGNAHSA